MYVWKYIYVCIYIHVHIYVYVCVYVCVCGYVHVCMWACGRVWACVCACVCVQIVVVGSQSSGKSSVLESIVGRDFLPVEFLKSLRFFQAAMTNDYQTDC